MKTLEYSFKDKSKWGEGPWQSEPDKLQFTDEATGLPCLIVRGPAGALCGYVGVAEGHPLFNQPHDNHYDLECHGGLTFSDFCHETPDNHGICHLPEPGEPDHVWWFGFDCAHDGDFMPGLAERLGGYSNKFKSLMEGSYRDLNYVKGQCKHLASQLAAVK